MISSLLHLISPYNIVFGFCILAVTYNINSAIFLPLLLLLELIIAIIGAQFRILVATLIALLLLMAEPSSKRLKECNTQMQPLLFEALELRFHHEKTKFLPQACNDWILLRVLDFLNFLTFNVELYQIKARLRLCGDEITENELINKTLSTFPLVSAFWAQW